MKLRTSLAISGCVAFLVAVGIAGCSQGPEDVDASVAASPIVQSAGVQRIKYRAADNVTTVDLLDAEGQQIGTLTLEATAEQQVHARQTLHGRTLDATWNAKELSFTEGSGEPVVLRAGEEPPDELQQTLQDASDALTVATYLAAQVDVYSPVVTDPGMLQPQDYGWGTGCRGHWNYSGTSSTWSSTSQSLLQCQQSSAQAAYSTCVQINGSLCHGTNTTSTTTVTSGYFTGYTCTTTISVGYNCY